MFWGCDVNLMKYMTPPSRWSSWPTGSSNGSTPPATTIKHPTRPTKLARKSLAKKNRRRHF